MKDYRTCHTVPLCVFILSFDIKFISLYCFLKKMYLLDVVLAAQHRNVSSVLKCQCRSNVSRRQLFCLEIVCYYMKIDCCWFCAFYLFMQRNKAFSTNQHVKFKLLWKRHKPTDKKQFIDDLLKWSKFWNSVWRWQICTCKTQHLHQHLEID